MTCLLCIQPLSIKLLFFNIVSSRNAIAWDVETIVCLDGVLFGIEKVTTDERRIEIVRIGPAVLVWTMKRSVDFSFICFLIEVDSPFGWTFADLTGGEQIVTMTAINHFSLMKLISLTINGKSY